MKTLLLLRLICLFCLLPFFTFAQEAVYLYQVDPLDKVLKDRVYFKDEVDTLCAARGEVVSVQIVLKANQEAKQMRAQVDQIVGVSNRLKGTVGWIAYVKAGRKYNPPSKDLLRTPSDYFPDPILTDTSMTIQAGEVQPLWVSVAIPLGTKAGIYRGTVVIHGTFGHRKKQFKKDFYIRVYPVEVAKTSLFISNWSAHFSPITLSALNNGVDVPLFSPLYWQLLKVHADMMVAHGQNVQRIFPIWMTTYTLKDSTYSFDFSRFDKEVHLFEDAGPLARIEGGHLAWRSGAWDDPYYVEVPVPATPANASLPKSPAPFDVVNNMRLVKLPLEDPRAQRFLNQFLPALKTHLEEKGWLNKYIQHIGDEPVAKNAASYQAISSYVRKYLPGVKIIDAVLTSKELRNGIDIWVPILDVLHKDYRFYQELQKEGKEVWYYTCVGPRGNYANRFIELPLIQTRYLHWINYKYGITGYLHWGFNFWSGQDILHQDASRDRGRLPAGDSHIVYPGYRKLYSSIRLEAMRDGIYDYELLKMLEKKYPEKAKSLVNNIILNFDNYDGSISYFRKIRKELLALLSK